jgi:hypothetical protein
MAGRADLNGILTNIKAILDAANTTTGSPIDLSSSLSDRVQTVMTLNPSLIKPEAEKFPLVTAFVTGKQIIRDPMAKGSANVKREAEIAIDIVGGVWNDTFVSSTADPADLDIHYLMESVELILRSNETLSGAVNWLKFDAVEYYDVSLREDSHLRSGVLSLKAKIFY